MLIEQELLYGCVKAPLTTASTVIARKNSPPHDGRRVHVGYTQASDWVRVGYTQSNFNSDNCLVSGRTVDFGYACHNKDTLHIKQYIIRTLCIDSLLFCAFYANSLLFLIM